MHKHYRVYALLLLSVLLTATGWAAVKRGTGTLTISGTPSLTATVGTTYSFKPSVTNGGRRLSYWITNKPSWASFNYQTGLLTGTPTVAGTYGGIVVGTTNSTTSASLPAFSIAVSAQSSASASSSSSSSSAASQAAASSSSSVTSSSSSSSSSVSSASSALTATCEKSSSSWVTTGIYDWKAYGNYVVNNNNWGGLPGQQIWANSESCWGVTTSSITERGSIGSYPTVTRGWATAAVSTLSTTGTNDWTTKSGLGIAVTQLTKAKATWAFTAPTVKTADLNDPPRWMALMDVYFHKTPAPSPYEWPPYLDLMINQALADQAVGTSTFYALVASMSNASTVTLGGIQYLVYIDQNGETTFHQTGGHNIHLFQLPTHFTNSTGTIWGTQNKTTTDLAAIISFFRQANPKDDLGQPLKNAAGVVISTPLIASDLYLTAINAGWEIDVGTQFTNTNFCVAMQNEADCP